MSDLRAAEGERSYLPIGDYGVIGDGRSVALVARDASIDWWCVPRFDSDPVFARLLDAERGGFWSIRPRGPFESSHSYLGDSAVLVTEFVTGSGVMRVLDFMPALTEDEKRTVPVPYREIVRRIEGITGRVPLEIRLVARPEFGRRTPRLRREQHQIYSIDWSGHALHLASSVPLAIEAGTLTGRYELTAGERIDLALAYSPEAPHELPILRSVDTLQQLTERFWRRWSARCRYAGPYKEAVMRSAATLKLLTYAPSGAIIAAPTTSLPELIGGSRNWDYRYCWLRDAAFTIRSLLSLGYQLEAHAFAQWLLHATRLTHPEVQVLYTIFGEAQIPEKTMEHLSGYRGSRPVRVGNAAAAQFQIDVYGEVLDALALYGRNGGTFDRDSRRLIKGMAEVILRRWSEPDDGIWEVRSGRAQHLHSKVMACIGLARAAELAQGGGYGISLERLDAAQQTIRAWVLEHGYNRELGAFTRTPGTDQLDAALLVMPLVGFLPADDPRLIGTIEAIQRRLARGELVYRYEGEDGLVGREGAFVICSFWLVEALARLGRLAEAQDLFERLLARRNPLGLLAEEIDPESGAQLGNFPQAFSHVGLINAALTLEEESRG